MKITKINHKDGRFMDDTEYLELHEPRGGVWIKAHGQPLVRCKTISMKDARLFLKRGAWVTYEKANT